MFLEVVAGYFFLLGEVKKYANSWRFCTDHHDLWANTLTEVRCRVDQTQAAQGEKYAWPYMDALMTGGEGCAPFSRGPHCPGMNADAYKTEYALWSLTQSPLIVSTDVREMTAVMKQTLLNQELLEIHSSTLTPPGRYIAAYPCTELLKCGVWGRALNVEKTSWLVALVNSGKRNHTIKIKWSHLGWIDEQLASVRDLWRHEELSNGTRTEYAMEVPSHGTAVLKMDAREKRSVVPAQGVAL